MFRKFLCILLSALILFFSFMQTVAAEDSVAVSDQQSGSSILPADGEPQFGDTRVVIPPIVMPPDPIINPDQPVLYVDWYLRYRNGRGNLYTPSYLQFVTQNGVDLKNYVHSVEESKLYRSDLLYGEFIDFVYKSDTTIEPIVSAGHSYTVTLNGLIANMEIRYNGVPWTTLRPDMTKLNGFHVYVYDINGERELLPDDSYYIQQGESINTFNILIDIDGLDYSVYKFTVAWEYYPEVLWPDLSKYTNNSNYTFCRWFGFGADLGYIEFFDHDDNSSGIFSWFGRILDAILYLPRLIADLILDGLSALFVPSQEFLVSFKEKFDTLLSERFGAVYQSVSLVDDLLDGISEADAQDTIHMPSATLDFGDTEFTFGGYDVKVVPDGFGTLVEVCKKAISLVCTIWFVNGLIKRYEELMDR